MYPAANSRLIIELERAGQLLLHLQLLQDEDRVASRFASISTKPGIYSQVAAAISHEIYVHTGIHHALHMHDLPCIHGEVCICA